MKATQTVAQTRKAISCPGCWLGAVVQPSCQLQRAQAHRAYCCQASQGSHCCRLVEVGPRRELLQKALDSSEEWNSKVLEVLAEANARQVRSDGQEDACSIGSADRDPPQAAHLRSGWGQAQLAPMGLLGSCT